jgi:hypothetical protein
MFVKLSLPIHLDAKVKQISLPRLEDKAHKSDYDYLFLVLNLITTSTSLHIWLLTLKHLWKYKEFRIAKYLSRQLYSAIEIDDVIYVRKAFRA